jgi:hypothetical protein
MLNLNRETHLPYRTRQNHQVPTFSFIILDKLSDGSRGVDDGGAGGIGCKLRQGL